MRLEALLNKMQQDVTDNVPEQSSQDADTASDLAHGQSRDDFIKTHINHNLQSQVNMLVFEEMVQVEGEQRKLTEVINETHENVKYLPGIKLPTNVLAESDLATACKDATLLIFVLPHQFLPRLLPTIRQASHPSCRGVSLIKGIGK